jgi:transposase
MSKVNRNEPKRSTASESRYTLMDFNRDFPDDAACLDFLLQGLYPDGIFCPKCQKITKHFREASRPSFACEYCGHHEHPMVGTIFENSATSLRLWFYGMYLMASTRCGISAKQLERELGVTYKCAWRMFNKIRSLMQADDAEPFAGTVEMDETYIGGKAKNMHWAQRKERIVGRGPAGKTPVFGVVQRGKHPAHGLVSAVVVSNTDAETLTPHIQRRVAKKTTVYTDEWAAYQKIHEHGYYHFRVAHSQGVYVSGDVHTNTIEGSWSLVKRGISGIYHSVSDKWLQSYLDEYAFRYNNRDAYPDIGGMFSALMGRVEKADSSGAASEQPA